jgi:hypothetical protein
MLTKRTMRKLTMAALVTLFLLGGNEAFAVQYYCWDCRWSQSGNKLVCYATNFDGYSDCYYDAYGCQEIYPICYGH